MSKSFTAEQFKEFSESAIWEINSSAETNDYEIGDGYTDDGEPRTKKRATAYIETTATCGDITVQHREEASWDGTEAKRFGGYECEPSSQPEWTLSGVTLVDEDGDELSGRDIDTALDDASIEGGLWAVRHDIDYENLIPEINEEEIEIESDMEEFTIKNDDAPDIRFKGEELAKASSATNNSTRWHVLKLWKTGGGKYICQQIGRTQWQGEVDRYKAAVCTSPAEVISFFGHGDTAKELYSQTADIDDVDTVE